MELQAGQMEGDGILEALAIAETASSAFEPLDNGVEALACAGRRPHGPGHQVRTACAFVVGAFFLVGGIANVFMLPAPLWFNAVDLILTYLPMAWLGSRRALVVKDKALL